MRIYVDADSCPVKDEVYRVAKRYALGVTLVSGTWLRVPTEPWIQLEVVADTGGLDAADDWIVEHAGDHDIVVTEDIILASRCLKQGCAALSPRGKAFTSASIGDALASRELMANLRELGAIAGGPSGFTKSDRSAFLQQLDKIVQSLKRRP
ncbi:MAG: YaiI/YqxD family protein [Longimicrobiales bacterium]